MITLILKRLVVFGMAILTMCSSGGKEWADSCAGHDFPRIAAVRQKPGTVRILSYNIRCADVNGVPAEDRFDIGVRQIKEVMPDSLGVQEATPEWMQTLDKELKLYDWVGVNRENGKSPMDTGESCPIFYLKTRFKLVDSGNFWLSETPDKPSFGPGAACRRICTWAKLRNRLTGETFIHVNTHFDHVSRQAREAGAQIVARFIAESCADCPVVFTADMNAQKEEAAYTVMTENLSDARECAADAVSYGTFHACSPETHENYIIDFILCSSDMDVKTYRTITKGVDDRFTSDHFPICADLAFGD